MTSEYNSGFVYFPIFSTVALIIYCCNKCCKGEGNDGAISKWSWEIIFCQLKNLSSAIIRVFNWVDSYYIKCKATINFLEWGGRFVF